MFKEQTVHRFKRWPFVLTGIVLLITAASAIILFLISSAHERNKETLADSVLITVVEDYREVRKMIVSSVQEEYKTIEMTGVKEDEMESIALAVSSFFEIGKQKDIDEAARRNNEDLQNINKAQDVVRELKGNLNSTTQEKDTQEFLSAMDHFYTSLDLFLEQLKLYKIHNGEMLSAIPIADIVAGSAMLQESIEKLHDLPESPEESNLNDIYETYINAFRILKMASDKAVHNLKMVKTSEQSIIQPMLNEVLGAHIALFQLSSLQNDRTIQRAEQYGTDIFTTQFDDDQSEMENISEQLHRTLKEIRYDSELSVLFNSVMSADSEARKSLARTDIPISIEGEDLETLVRKYERPEMVRRANELEVAIRRLEEKKLIQEEAAEESASFHIHIGTTNFTITSSFHDGPAYEIDMIDPNGRRFSARNTADFVSDDKFQSIYRFGDPSPGEWTVIPLVPEGERGIQFTIQVYAYPTELYR